MFSTPVVLICTYVFSSITSYWFYFRKQPVGKEGNQSGLVTLLLLPVSILQRLGLLNHRENEERIPTTTKKILTSRAVDDDYIVDKKQKTKFSNKLKQSMTWLYHLGRRPNKLINYRNLGDGLDSIFATSPNMKRGKSFTVDKTSHSFSSNLNLSNIIGNLDRYQEFAFAALFDSGLFMGADTSSLNELCSNASLLKKNKGETILHQDDPHQKKVSVLYILKSGSCTVSYFDESGQERQKVDLVKAGQAGQVVGGGIDIIAWICRCEIKRNITVECLEPCEFVVLPSPREENGSYLSQSHSRGSQVALLSRIIRMLLIRFNRTTVLTAFFQFGLATYFLPSFPRLVIDDTLRAACLSHSLSSEDRLNALNLLMKQSIMQLYGLKSDNEVDVVKSDKLFYRGGTGGGSLDEDNTTSFPASPTFLPDNSTPIGHPLTVDDGGGAGDNDDSIPIPLSKRVLSFDSTIRKFDFQDDDDDSNKPFDGIGAGDTAGAMAFGHSQGCGLCLMRRGQTILDLDTIPGLYLILSGSLRVIASSHSMDLFNPLRRRDHDKSGAERGEREEQGCGGDSDDENDQDYPTLSDGNLLGQIALFAGSSEEWYGRREGNSRPFLRVLAAEDTWMIKLPLATCFQLLRERPLSMIHLGERIATSIPPLIHLFDFCMKTVNLNGGDDLVTGGEQCRGELFCVLSGRLRIVESDHPQQSHHQQQQQGGNGRGLGGGGIDNKRQHQDYWARYVTKRFFHNTNTLALTIS